MMAKEPRVNELCQICKRPKKVHSPQDLQACQKKMGEFKKEKTGGAGIH